MTGLSTRTPLLRLASKSPRRSALLTEAGLGFVASVPPVDDGVLSMPQGGVPAHWVAALAYLKARASAEAHPTCDRLSLGADTVCVLDARVIGQPASAREAERMIRGFEGRTHDVLTGVALWCPGTRRRELFVERAVVSLGVLDDRDRRAYVESGAWAGKAGGYNLTERVAAGWPLSFEGRASTIVGLPIETLIEVLDRFIDRGAAA